MPESTPRAMLSCIRPKSSPLALPKQSSPHSTKITDKCGTQPKWIMVMPITATTSAAITAASRGCISNKASLVSFTCIPQIPAWQFVPQIL